MTHPCLQTSEMVDMICRFVEDQSTLASLARTCKSFSGPALDHLWCEMHCLEPLLQCFPNCVWSEDDDRERQMHFSGPLLPSDWSRFMVYAPLVRTLVYSPMEQASPTFGLIREHKRSTLVLNGDLFQALSIAAPSLGCILPNLHRLVWDPKDDAFPYIRLFLSPRITAVSLKLDDYDAKHALLSILPNLLPALQGVDLGPSRNFSPLDPDIVTASASILGWKNLRFVRVINLNYAAFLHLAALPNLTKLEVTMLSEIVKPTTDIPNKAVLRKSESFPSLRELYIGTRTINSCPSLFVLMFESPISSIEISVWGPPSSLSALLVKIGTHCHKLSLKRLIIKEEHRTRHTTDAIVDINPLLQFSNLEILDINTANGVALSPSDLLSIAKAWPSIIQLDLMSYHLPAPRPLIKLENLAVFVERCPQLQSLGLTLDASSPADYTPQLGYNLSHNNLTRLHVGPSPVSHPHLVATFISSVFPNISEIFAFLGPGGCSEAWKQVLDTTQAMTAIRKQTIQDFKPQ